MDLADPPFYKAAGIDVVGADLYQSIITEGLVDREKGVPVAHYTVFGRILFGVYIELAHLAYTLQAQQIYKVYSSEILQLYKHLKFFL